jgi:hypothetical protein
MVDQEITIFIAMLKLRFIQVRSLIFLINGTVFSCLTLAQSAEEQKNIFARAESYFIYEEYELANNNYLLLDAPGNLNLKYKIGTCYLNIPGEKEKSVSFLEAAVKGVSNDAKTESFKESRAPLDAYFSLAKAYMINNEFEKAILTLQTFSRLVRQARTEGSMKNFEYVDQLIQACKNAIAFRQVPVVFSLDTLGSDLNQGSINENPAVSFDGNTMVYTERRGIVNTLFFSKKVNGKWQPPVEITSRINAGTDCSSCSLNSDGTELFLYKTDNYDGAIYSSSYVNGSWTPIRKLNKNINTKFYESHASVSADGKKLYFTSNREGGSGNLDIYVSKKDATGNWGPAVNLGPAINTPFNEDTPFITSNDSVLYFCSEGHNSMGGYDNFRSIRSGSTWKTPSNLGYSINSADDDKFFQPANNGKNAYYSITTDYKKKDIFCLHMGVGKISRDFKIAGRFVASDTILLNEKNYHIKIMNKVTGDTLYKGHPDKEGGSYSMNVAPGLFRIFYSADGYFPVTVDTMIVQDSPTRVVNIDVMLYPDTITGKTIEKIDLSKIPTVASVDTSILIKNLNVADVSDKRISDSEVLYYTVQVIALYKPVDVTYFKTISDMKVMYNDKDKFYRYTTGRFSTKEEAYSYRLKLLKKGYPDEIFVKKISR